MIKTLDQSSFLKRCDTNESLYHVYARCKDIKYKNQQLKKFDDLRDKNSHQRQITCLFIENCKRNRRLNHSYKEKLVPEVCMVSTFAKFLTSQIKTRKRGQMDRRYRDDNSLQPHWLRAKT